MIIKQTTFILAFLLTTGVCFGQVLEIEPLDRLEQPVYDKMNEFNLIMIGEMHGTNEPANFLIGLAELFANHGDTVQVGFEIPSEMMTAYLQSLTDSSVFQSDFFLNNSADGRASIAWANAIARLTKKSNVKIFFYDIDKYGADAERDSLMYLKIKGKIIEHPHWRTITLSGNIHNMRIPFRGKLTTAYHLCNDKELNLSEKICTLSHIYQSGTMLNNIGNGLEIRQINNEPSAYSEVGLDNYLYLYPTAGMYDGIFFTKTVTASELVNMK
jgi:hypothetical protein